MTEYRPAPRRRAAPGMQRGATLIVTMVMLLLVLMLGVAGIRTVTLDTRIVGNLLETQRLQETADGVLRVGERRILRQKVALFPCEKKAPQPQGVPCYVSEARSDPLGLDSSYAASAKAGGFDKPFGYWYARHVATACPKGSGSTSGLDKPKTGCTEFYELNAQATFAGSKAQDCGPEGLCLRSTVSLFIK